jgi:hypothetical protein
VISGFAYGRRATLEVQGDTLVWRAQRGGLAHSNRSAENIVTTVHDVRSARYLAMRWSYAGLALLGLGGIWAAALDSLVVGAVGLVGGAGLLVWRLAQPRHVLVIELGDRQLLLRLALESATEAKTLAERIDRARATGEVPASPPTLP